MLKSSLGFSFENRNLRPPKDPVNATLSYQYGILVKELFSTVLAISLSVLVKLTGFAEINILSRAVSG